MSAAGPSALCIIPARGGSRRFPRKNLAQFKGVPLVARAVAVARESGVFRTVCVSSDDPEVLAVARDAGADLALERGRDLSAYDRQVKDVCQSVLLELARRGDEYPMFGVLLPTSPLREAADVRRTHDALAHSTAECAMTLVPFDHPPLRALHIVDGFVQSRFGDEQMRPAQLLEELYRHDGTALFVRTDVFLRTPRFYGLRIVPCFVPIERAVDVDRPIDLAWAEFLARDSSRSSPD